MLHFLPWLLRGVQRPEYNILATGGAADVSWEVSSSGRLLLSFIAARLAFNAALRRPLQRLAERRGDSPHHRDGTKLLEECWVGLGNILMLAASQYVVLQRNGGCWYLDTSPCLAGWPNLSTDPAAKLYYNAELAWYLHMLLKGPLGYGLHDARGMIIHHFATLALILLSYGANLTRIGVLVLAVFAISNPLLHVAKVCNQLSLGPLKIGGFVVFAVAFFLSRVLLVPLAILKPTLVDSMRVVPYIKEDYPGLWWTANGLLLLLYGMQLHWMAGIVRVLRSAIKHGADAASQMSAKLDPAKRYAVPTVPAVKAEQAALVQEPAAATPPAAITPAGAAAADRDGASGSPSCTGFQSKAVGSSSSSPSTPLLADLHSLRQRAAAYTAAQ